MNTKLIFYLGRIVDIRERKFLLNTSVVLNLRLIDQVLLNRKERFCVLRRCGGRSERGICAIQTPHAYS